MARLRRPIAVLGGLAMLAAAALPAFAQVAPATPVPGQVPPMARQGAMPGAMPHGVAAPAAAPDLAANHRRLVERRRAEERALVEFGLLGQALRPRRDR